MKNSIKFLALLSFSLVTFTSWGDSRKEFIQKYKHIAIDEMKRTGIPASIKLAQGILESSCGYSNLSMEANNYFGIKCHTTWEGSTFHQDDDDENECFRKYSKVEDSWIDHSEFLTSRPRYAFLFELSSTDYKNWAKGLKKAGYATNPMYADLLIKIIEEEELYLYDKEVNYRNIQNEPVKRNPRNAISSEKFDNYNKREDIKNGIAYIEAKSGDSYEKIATYYGIKVKKLLSYNDKKTPELKTGEYIYLKRKKTRAAKGYDFHRAKEGDNLYNISQQYGVRLKSLIKYNYLYENEALLEGEKIYLRSKSGI